MGHSGEQPGLVVNRPRRSRWWGLVVLVLVPLLWWRSSSAPELPVSEARVETSTPVDRPVFVGVFTARADFDRTLLVSGVKVQATSSVPLTIRPWLCRGGAVGVTTEPRSFCREFVDPAGESLTAGDTVVLEISGSQPGAVLVERVRLAFREGLRWDTHPAGSQTLVTLLGR